MMCAQVLCPLKSAGSVETASTSLSVPSVPFQANDVIVLASRVVVTVAAPRRRALDAKRSGHPEMHQQRVAGTQHDKKVFAAALDRTDPMPLDPRRKIRWKRPPQSGAAQHDAND